MLLRLLLLLRVLWLLMLLLLLQMVVLWLLRWAAMGNSIYTPHCTLQMQVSSSEALLGVCSCVFYSESGCCTALHVRPSTCKSAEFLRQSHMTHILSQDTVTCMS